MTLLDFKSELSTRKRKADNDLDDPSSVDFSLVASGRLGGSTGIRSRKKAPVAWSQLPRRRNDDDQDGGI